MRRKVAAKPVASWCFDPKPGRGRDRPCSSSRSLSRHSRESVAACACQCPWHLAGTGSQVRGRGPVARRSSDACGPGMIWLKPACVSPQQPEQGHREVPPKNCGLSEFGIDLGSAAVPRRKTGQLRGRVPELFLRAQASSPPCAPSESACLPSPRLQFPTRATDVSGHFLAGRLDAAHDGLRFGHCRRLLD